MLDEGSLSSAAKRMRLTQPALSRSLVKLRSEFDDVLFVRSPSGMIPTARALALEPELRRLLESAEALYHKPDAFDPSVAKGVIKIATTDYFEQVIWSEELPILARQAPNLIFVTLMTGSQLPVEAMRRGEIQLAIAGFFKDVPAGFMRQELFKDHYATLARKGHPRLKSGLSRKAYYEEAHLVVSPRGELEGSLNASTSGLTRKVAGSVSSFLASGPIIAKSDLLLTAPSLLAKKFLQYLPLQSFEPPIPAGKISVVQVWSERFQSDPVAAWVRGQIFTGCRELISPDSR